MRGFIVCALVVAVLGGSLQAGGPCDSPVVLQSNVLVTGVGGGISYPSDPIWTGSGYAMLSYSFWMAVPGRQLSYVRLTADGAPQPPPLNLGPEYVSYTNGFGLAANGSGVLAYWTDGSLRMARISEAGELLGETITLNAGERTHYASIAWTGTEYGVVRNVGDPADRIIFTRLDASGNQIQEDVDVYIAPGSRVGRPSLTWTGSDYGLTWHDRVGQDRSFLLARLDAAGALLGPVVHVFPLDPDFVGASTVWNGTEYGLVWSERGEDDVIQYRFTLLDVQGTLTAPPQAIPRGSLGWNGDGWTVVWIQRSGISTPRELYLQRLSYFGRPIGAERRLGVGSNASSARLVWSGSRYGITWVESPDFEYSYIVFGTLGCPCYSSGAEGTAYVCDNCPDLTNPDQSDRDLDEVGDACDPCPDDADNDIDEDTVCGDEDNCPDVPNELQQDGDFDDSGDACDNCPHDPNPSQQNTDSDPFGDVCDNCPVDFDSLQEDRDSDTVGDACDNCPDAWNVGQEDEDGDQVGQICDNCLDVANANQSNGDADLLGDACDNCRFYPNAAQVDFDDDGEGDVCDVNDGRIWLDMDRVGLVGWQREVGVSRFNLYRGDLGLLRTDALYTQEPGSVPAAWQACDLSGYSLTDPWVPDSGRVAHYLVSAGAPFEGLGPDSNGAPRPSHYPCP